MGADSNHGDPRRLFRARTSPERTWDGFLTDNLKWVIVTLAIPLVGGWITNRLGEQAEQRAFADRVASNQRAAEDRKAADERTRQDARQRAYTDLINKREEAEMGVRSNIFSTLLHDYLDPAKANLAQRLTVLELLASNFDESLNLSPLFWQIDREIASQPAASRAALREQLANVATAVKVRQVDVLAASGARADLMVGFDNFRDSPFEEPLRFVDPASSASSAKGCLFKLRLLSHDASRHRFYAVVTSDATEGDASRNSSCLDRTKEPPQPQQWSFWVDEFDFPLISYTRLSATERFAVVLVAYDGQQRSATFSLVFFPSSRGGARDRPFIDTVIQALNDAPGEPAPRTPGGAAKETPK